MQIQVALNAAPFPHLLSTGHIAESAPEPVRCEVTPPSQDRAEGTALQSWQSTQPMDTLLVKESGGMEATSRKSQDNIGCDGNAHLSSIPYATSSRSNIQNLPCLTGQSQCGFRNQCREVGLHLLSCGLTQMAVSDSYSHVTNHPYSVIYHYLKRLFISIPTGQRGGSSGLGRAH